ncbi:MAG TPA: LssY C-terminal domain-containing protein [Terriglobia bacterium]|nr:LssY C-terminal domain-containing protein [Terriglobia bacterium]
MSRKRIRALARCRTVLALALFGLTLAESALGVASERMQVMMIRLLTPLASYQPAGTLFDARVIGPELRGGAELLPSDSIVTGEVEKSESVRFGIRRERAMLQLQFNDCLLPDGTPVACKVELQGVDNARETVKANRIEGVLAASHPYSFLGGVWYRPTTSLFTHSAAGLTGAAGMLYPEFIPSPIGALAAAGSRMLLERIPDPEIQFPAGTELLVQVRVPDDLTASEERLATVPSEMSKWVAAQPEDVYLPDKKLAGDLIHLVLVGSREQVQTAFSAAGWSTSDSLTRRSFSHMFEAFSSMRADPVAPMAALTYRGSTSALAFQKVLNTVSKRHHIRIWQGSFPGTQLWLAAATHDVTIALDGRHLTLTHRIDPLVDRERSMVVNDLVSTGCVSGVGSVERPQAARLPGDGQPSMTDGNVAVVFLENCEVPQPVSEALQEPRHSRASLAVRNFVLENREYLERGSIFYLGYRAASSVLHRKHETAAADAESFADGRAAKESGGNEPNHARNLTSGAATGSVRAWKQVP